MSQWKKGRKWDWEVNLILWGEKNQSRFTSIHNLVDVCKIVGEIIK